jgi:coatomer subunit beta'
MYLLGYLPRDGRVYICDKDLTVMSYALSLAIVEFQTLVLRDELEEAMNMMPGK